METHWKGRGVAAAAVARKAREAAPPKPRDYIEEAEATVGFHSSEQPRSLLGAVIIAQAIDRLGTRIVEAASIANRKKD